MKYIITAVLCILTFGCTNQPPKSEQLSAVAKGWCETIRASQVLPVYPLTEDLEVGDIFIVQRPIEDEVESYTVQGFLPLGQHIGRLAPEDFTYFYGHSGFGNAELKGVPPGMWRATTKPTDSSPKSDGIHREQTYWKYAPRAAFPSYSFEIRRSAGIQTGLPVQGVPVAFGLLGSDTASATVTLADAYSYGLDFAYINQLTQWWCDSNSAVIGQFAPRYIRKRIKPFGEYFPIELSRWDLQYNYLRVITRVYYVGRVNVSVQDASSSAFDASAGKTGALNLLGDARGMQYSDLLNRLNIGLANAEGIGSSTTQPTSQPTSNPSVDSPLLGARLKFASLTSRSVTLAETFDRPLAIGYLAYDFPIDYNGRIVLQPVATNVRLRRYNSSVDIREVRAWANDTPQVYEALRDWLGDAPDSPNRQLVVAAFGAGADDASMLQKKLAYPSIWTTMFPNQEKRVLYNRLVNEIVEAPPGVQRGGGNYEADPIKQVQGLYTYISATQPTTQPTRRDLMKMSTQPVIKPLPGR